MNVKELTEVAFGDAGMTGITVTPELRTALGAGEQDALVLVHDPIMCVISGGVLIATRDRVESGVPALGFVTAEGDVQKHEGEGQYSDTVGKVEDLTLGDRVPFSWDEEGTAQAVA